MDLFLGKQLLIGEQQIYNKLKYNKVLSFAKCLVSGTVYDSTTLIGGFSDSGNCLKVFCRQGAIIRFSPSYKLALEDSFGGLLDFSSLVNTTDWTCPSTGFYYIWRL